MEIKERQNYYFHFFITFMIILFYDNFYKLDKTQHTIPGRIKKNYRIIELYYYGIWSAIWHINITYQ